MANATITIHQTNGAILTVSGLVDEAHLAEFAPQLANLLLTLTSTSRSASA